MYLQPSHLDSEPKRKRVVKPSASTTGHDAVVESVDLRAESGAQAALFVIGMSVEPPH